MGEVYRARDTRLQREVAVKILPERLSGDAESLGRFEREARALAALNHPGIAAIHGIEQADGIHFLVLELVPGETLGSRLERGPLPMEVGLRIASHVAEALEAAHEGGILHRDLKPGNIQLTGETGVKLLDFGLAKTVATVAATDVASSPTMTAVGATRAGTVLGTPLYMSPEQARGKPVDRRTDIWSFGCILYEILAGRRAFEGDTVSDVVAAVLTKEPDLGALPRATPPSIRHLLGRCLEKDPSHRLKDAGDARLEIEQALSSFATPPRSARPGLPWPVAAALVAAALVALVGTLALRGRHPAVLAPQLSPVTFDAGVEEFPAWSPDGQSLAFSAERGEVRKIVTKALSATSETPLTRGEFDDIQPDWPPDGHTLAFVRAQVPGKRLEPGDLFGKYVGGDVWVRDAATGAESKLVDNAFNPAWSPDGKTLAVDAAWAGAERIWLVDQSGHNPQQLTTDTSEGLDHVRPRWSPDGQWIVFQSQERTRFDLRVVNVASKKMTSLTNGLFIDLNPVWSRSGRFVYFTSNRGGGWNIWRVPVTSEGAPADAVQQLTTGPGQDVEPALSPDGKHLAFAILKQNANIWRLPVSPDTGRATGAPEEVIATTRENSRGAWSPDGARIAFNSDRAGDMNIWVFDVESRQARALTQGPGGDYQPEWFPDRKRIAFFSSRGGSLDVWTVDADSGELRQLTKARSVEVNPFVSPDGKQIAYQSDQGGRPELWVMKADGSEPRQLTHAGVGGHFFRWTNDGHGVVFRCLCGGKPQAMVAPLAGGEPEALPQISGGSHMSFSLDRSRVMDVVGHKTLWVSPLKGGAPERVFDLQDAGARIDYPVWSPDGRFVLFDRFQPQGGDIWLLTGFE
jgi:Tol biopolymer transport system component